MPYNEKKYDDNYKTSLFNKTFKQIGDILERKVSDINKQLRGIDTIIRSYDGTILNIDNKFDEKETGNMCAELRVASLTSSGAKLSNELIKQFMIEIHGSDKHKFLNKEEVKYIAKNGKWAKWLKLNKAWAFDSKDTDIIAYFLTRKGSCVLLYAKKIAKYLNKICRDKTTFYRLMDEGKIKIMLYPDYQKERIAINILMPYNHLLDIDKEYGIIYDVYGNPFSNGKDWNKS